MSPFIKRHREGLTVGLLGLLIMAGLNIMMLHYHYAVWTNPKVGFWSAFYNRFELSGFDSFTYILVSSWRPLYALFRHPLLAAMMWPFAELNAWLKDITGINCAIFIVAVLWTLINLASWTLMYRIIRRIISLPMWESLLMTLFFFSFSHIMLVTFTPDHMAISMMLLLLTVYLSGKAIKAGRAMPLWQSLPLLFVSTGVTTTNMVKVGLADLFTLVGKKPWLSIIRHFMLYLLPLAVIAGLFVLQKKTTQAEETRSNTELMRKKALKDSVFAKQWEKDKAARRISRSKQLIQHEFVTNTEYHIDRLPSVVENIFGEGFILHERYTLKDANKDRPALVRYEHWWNYACEALLVTMFAIGVWCGRRERLMWITMSMFLFDMFIHVGLNFASADAYIMTAHWAFVIPVAVAYLLRRAADVPWQRVAVTLSVLFLTIFMWTHNLSLIVKHILK